MQLDGAVFICYSSTKENKDFIAAYHLKAHVFFAKSFTGTVVETKANLLLFR